MAVRIQIGEEEIHAWLTGEIDHHVAGELRDAIDAACQSSQLPLLLLDFGGVTFMDSSGIGLIMGRYRLMQELGGQVRVIHVPRALRKVMLVSGLERLGVLETGTGSGWNRGGKTERMNRQP